MTPKLILVLTSVVLTAIIVVCVASPAPGSGLHRSDDAHSTESFVSFNLHQEYDLDTAYDDIHEQQGAFRISPPPSSQTTPTFELKARPTTVYRPRSTDDFQRARLRSLRYAESEVVEWEQVEMAGPDIEDQHTLSQLARMTGNAYALPMGNNWYDMDPAWNTVSHTIALESACGRVQIYEAAKF